MDLFPWGFPNKVFYELLNFPTQKNYPANFIILNFMVQIDPVFNNYAIYRPYSFL